MSKRCEAMTKAGNRCKAIAVEHGRCAFHADPTLAARLGRKGGRKNRRKVSYRVKQFSPPRTAKEIREILSTTMADIQNGRRAENRDCSSLRRSRSPQGHRDH